MKGMLLLGFCLLPVLSWADSSSLLGGSEKKVIVPWVISDWPPYYVISGPDKGEGRTDRLKRVLVEALPDFHFTDVKSDNPRAVDLWKQGRNICSGSALMTEERKKWAYFTALSFQVPHEYVLVTSNQKLWDSLPGTIVLKDFLQMKQWKGIIGKGRSYGAAVDEVLALHNNSDFLLHHTQPEGYVQLLRLVEKGRYDYTIEYESVVRAQNEKNFPVKPLLVRQIKESLPSAVIYFACTKNEWGKRVASRVDEVLRGLATSKEYQSAVESWIGPEVLKQNRKLLDDFYQKRSRGSWTTARE